MCFLNSIETVVPNPTWQFLSIDINGIPSVVGISQIALKDEMVVVIELKAFGKDPATVTSFTLTLEGTDVVDVEHTFESTDTFIEILSEAYEVEWTASEWGAFFTKVGTLVATPGETFISYKVDGEDSWVGVDVLPLVNGMSIVIYQGTLGVVE